MLLTYRHDIQYYRAFHIHLDMIVIFVQLSTCCSITEDKYKTVNDCIYSDCPNYIQPKPGAIVLAERCLQAEEWESFVCCSVNQILSFLFFSSWQDSVSVNNRTKVGNTHDCQFNACSLSNKALLGLIVQ